MLLIDKNGTVVNDRVKRIDRPLIVRGEMPVVRGIIVHQTAARTAASTLAQYTHQHANGAHFLIDTDGSIQQTASVHKKTFHVGNLKARCNIEMRCSSKEQALLKRYDPVGEARRENRKSVPDRFPSNVDAIGIELVGESIPGTKPLRFFSATEAQNQSLIWLVSELRATFNIGPTEVFRHPTVSRKEDNEAISAKWQ